MTRSTASFGVVEALAIADLESRRRLGPVQRATLAALRELRDRSREESDAGRGLYELRSERGRSPRLTQRPPLASSLDRRS